MLNVALLTTDTKMASDIGDWLLRLDGVVKFQIYANLKQFALAHLGVLPPDDQLAVSTPQPTTGPAVIPDLEENLGLMSAEELAKLHNVQKTIRLIIVDFEFLEQSGIESPGQWCTDTKVFFGMKGFSDPLFPTQVMGLAFGTPEFKAERYQVAGIDDLVMKPLDRELFLQKVELLLTDKPGGKPSFLFRQKTVVTIEAGKDAVVEQISDFALSLRSRAPLSIGMFLAVYSEVFGTGNDARLLCRVFANTQHPKRKGEHLVHACFFGVSARQLSSIRHHLFGKAPGHHELNTKGSVPHPVAPTTKGKRGDDKKIDAEKRLEKRTEELSAIATVVARRIAVIDMNPDTATDLSSIYGHYFQDFELRRFPSYSRFLSSIIGYGEAHGTISPAAGGSIGEPRLAGAEPPKETPKAAVSSDKTASKDFEPSFFPNGGNRLSAVLSLDRQELLGFEPPQIGRTHVLGRSVAEWMSRPDWWSSSIFPEDREDWAEFVSYLARGAAGHLTVRMLNAEQNIIYLQATGMMSKPADQEGAPVLKIEFMEISHEAWLKKNISYESPLGMNSCRYDAIYIDGGIIRTDVVEWFEALRTLFIKSGVLVQGEPMPQIVILGEERSSLRIAQYRVAQISGFILKPLDRKFVAESASILVPRLRRKEDVMKAHMVPCLLSVRLAKDVEMRELSEYGLTIAQKTPIRQGAYMKFFSPIFSQSADGVIGRCTLSEPVGDDKKTYECQFVFFGVTDELFKKIRNWIRETYVQKKEN